MLQFASSKSYYTASFQNGNLAIKEYIAINFHTSFFLAILNPASTNSTTLGMAWEA